MTFQLCPIGTSLVHDEVGLRNKSEKRKLFFTIILYNVFSYEVDKKYCGHQY